MFTLSGNGNTIGNKSAFLVNCWSTLIHFNVATVLPLNSYKLSSQYECICINPFSVGINAPPLVAPHGGLGPEIFIKIQNI